MTRHHALAFGLLDALVREDAHALDRTAAAIRNEELTQEVLCTVSALLVSALVNAHGPMGALAMLDQAAARHTEWAAQ